VYDPRVAAGARSIRAVGHGGTLLKIKVLTASAIVLAVLLLGPWTSRADVAAGKARFNAVCGECHDSADFENENPQALAATLRRIVSGELRHKKPLQLSDREIQDIAAYMSTGGK
jgi:mono/diheme cytochrome c family protein